MHGCNHHSWHTKTEPVLTFVQASQIPLPRRLLRHLTYRCRRKPSPKLPQESVPSEWRDVDYGLNAWQH